ncbi:thiamine monophosphate synthase [Rhizobium leguminosarum]|nr:thiamine monophosphate synthase [Rhizobium leguminosarum]
MPLGVRLVQLRIKDCPDSGFGADPASKTACAAPGSQLVVNDYWKLAMKDAISLIPGRKT